MRSYPRTLDDACAGLPCAQARELHEQIAAHLEDALPPDADDATVRAELTRLGRATAIAASGEIGWLNPADQAVAVDTTAGDVVGVGPDWQFGSLPGMSHVSVATVPGQLSDSYTSPGSIPPHSTRNVHVWWTSNECTGAGGGFEAPDIMLRVRVGTVTRTEDIQLQMTFVPTGPKHSIIRDCQ